MQKSQSWHCCIPQRHPERPPQSAAEVARLCPYPLHYIGWRQGHWGHYTGHPALQVVLYVLQFICIMLLGNSICY